MCEPWTVPAPDEWEQASAQLASLIGEVTITMADIEDSLDELLLDLLSSPPAFSFFKRRVLGRWMIGAKLDLLISYATEFADVVSDSATALTHLRSIKAMSEERNRLIHDLHEVSIDDGRVTRRRIWESEASPIDLASYRELSERLSIMVAPGVEAIADALTIDSRDVR